MRVLHVTSGNMFGGVETFLVTLAKARGLCREMQPEFALCFPGRLREELSTSGVPVYDLGQVRVSRPWTVFKAREKLSSLLKDRRFDCVICHMPWTQAIFGTLVRKRQGEFVSYFHNPTCGGWPEWIACRTGPKLLIAPSKHAIETWKRAIPGVRAEVLNYPIPPQMAGQTDLDPSQRHAIRKKCGAQAGDVVILQASRIESWKGPDIVLRALVRLAGTPGWRFWLAGGVQRPSEEVLFKKLQKIAEEGGIADRVAFLGQRSDVSDLMRSADIYCQGNRGPEGFSLSFLEASYSGIPIVTTNIGGAPEMVDDSTGILVPPSEDAESLAEALKKLILQPHLRNDMGIKSKKKAFELCDTGKQLNLLREFLADENK